MQNILFLNKSQILFKIGSKDKKLCFDSRNTYINGIHDKICHSPTSDDIWCQVMTSDVNDDIDIYVFGIKTKFLFV